MNELTIPQVDAHMVDAAGVFRVGVKTQEVAPLQVASGQPCTFLISLMMGASGYFYAYPPVTVLGKSRAVK